MSHQTWLEFIPPSSYIVDMSVIESIMKDLKNLPTPKLVEVARYVHGLSQADQEVRRELLRQTHGVHCRFLEKSALALRNLV